MEIVAASTESHLDGVRRLMRGFVAWQHVRHAADRAMIDRYFDNAAFEAELAGLPGAFAPPEGRLLVAVEDGVVAGTVALRNVGGGVSEMKRMFVDPGYHGRGVGRLLGEAIVVEAAAAGYAKMRLDTGPRQVEALGLYRRLGFVETRPNSGVPEEMRGWPVFMEKDLAPGTAPLPAGGGFAGAGP